MIGSILLYPRSDSFRYAQCSRRGGLTQSPTRLRRNGLFTWMLWPSKLATHQLKKPSTLRVGGFVPFAGQSSNQLVIDLLKLI